MPQGPKIRPRPSSPDPDSSVASRFRRARPSEEDDEETPVQTYRRRARGEDDDGEVATGMLASGRAGAAKVAAAAPSLYAPRFEVPDAPRDQPVIIKFIDEDPPVVAYSQHWPEWLRTVQGKKGFVCLGTDCPLCDIGDPPQYAEHYNVIDLRNPESPLVTVLKASKTLAKRLALLDRSKKDPTRYGELAREDMYYSIIRTNNLPGDKGVAVTTVDAVKERDLEDDWGIVPLTSAQLDKLYAKAWPADKIITADKRSLLEAAADAAPEG